MGGTTTLDIGNDLTIKGGVINTNRAQGTIGGNVNIESLQDTATYDSDQKNMGFSADLDLAKGTGSSLSVNADSKIVNEQSGIFSNEADLVAEGKGTFKGGMFVTSKEAQTNDKSNIVFKQGVSSQDIKNTTSYEGEALSIGLSIGNTTGKPQATMNGIGYGTDSDSDSSITKGGVSGYNDPQGILTTENREALGGKLESVFDANQVNEELGAQTQITQAFDQERRNVKTEINKKEQKLRDEAEEAFNNGNFDLAEEKALAASELKRQGLLFDAISGAIYRPNSNGATGYVARAASPFGVLGAAISYATGNDAVTGGVSAGAGEATAPLLSQFLYGTKDSSRIKSKTFSTSKCSKRSK
ncbi:hemagglutinin repeat-containing protein [Psychrobacter sp. NZS113]|nr:hemagglutinin repeat-containing protein [Psychrobacter sp. NZS113]